MSGELVENVMAQLCSNYKRYLNLTARSTAFLAAAHMHENQKALELVTVINTDRYIVPRVKLHEAANKVCDLTEETPP